MHPRVQQFLNVKHNRVTNRTGAFAIEGTWAVRAALDAGADVDVAFVCPDLIRGDETRRLLARIGRVQHVGERTLRRMVDRDGPDGVAALVYKPSIALGDVALAPSARLVIADCMELAGNLGTLIRCADAAGASAVILTERRVRLSHSLVVKASMGTVFSMPIVDCERDDALAWLRGNRARVIAADPASELSYRDVDYTGRVAVVVGSERYGLAPFWRDEADVVASIPMLGRADSLNVGHAAALLLYEALRTA